MIENMGGSIKINPELILYKAAFKTQYMTRGKTATLNVLVSTNTEAVEIYDDFGNKVNIISQVKTSVTSSIPDSVFITSKFKESNVGTRTYTIYALDAEGKRSAGYVQASIIVR